MFHLDACIHLDEIKPSTVKKEFEGSCAAITDALAGLDAGATNFIALLGGDSRSGRLFDDFLVAALCGTVALPKMNGVAVLVSDDLDFNVAGLFQEFFQVDRGIAKSALSFLPRQLQRVAADVPRCAPPAYRGHRHRLKP